MKDGSGILLLVVGGLVAYFLLKRPASTAPVVVSDGSGGFIPYASARPFDWLSVDPVVTGGSTPGGYQPPVFNMPVLPAPGAIV